MNLLLVTLVFPFPINDGGKSGTYRMVDALRDKHNVTLICPESSTENLNELIKLWPNVHILTFKNCPQVAVDGFLVNIVKGFLGRKITHSKQEVLSNEMHLNTSNLINYYFENLIEIFKQELQKDIYDLVQIDFIDLAPLVHYVPNHIPKVFVHHELRYKRMARERDTIDTPCHSFDWKILNTKILEIGIMNLFDRVICLTEIDRQVLLEDGVTSEKLEVSPLPMILTDHNINQPFKFVNRLVFLGPDQHYPNLDGINWFLSNCWNEIQRLNPGIRLSIVGKWSDAKKKWFKNYSGVTFEGFVPDLTTILKGSIMIVPLRIGSGMRMKILEGVSYNVPIVSSSIGAEGLPMVNDENCRIADTPYDFIMAVHQVINNHDLQHSFIKNAKKILSKGYSATECAKKRENIYSTLLDEVKLSLK